MNNADARIAELELKLALTEDHLDALNRTIFRQQQQMDLLQEQLRTLHRLVHAADGNAESNVPSDELPPHY
jgi:SlyX protein